MPGDEDLDEDLEEDESVDEVEDQDEDDGNNYWYHPSPRLSQWQTYGAFKAVTRGTSVVSN